MGTGYSGTFVISWTQTELDGLSAAPLSALRVGTAWSWMGDPVRVDGPAQVLRLGAAIGEAEFKARVGRGARRIIRAEPNAAPRPPLMKRTSRCFRQGSASPMGSGPGAIMLILPGPGRLPLLMVKDDLPPRGTDLWVIGHNVQSADALRQARTAEAVVCFTPGTRIATETGPKAIEALLPGDRIQTRDNGCQPLVWLGRRHVSGARLKAMPELAPVRFAPGALGAANPDETLLVSPAHRVLVAGARAETLWNTPEVLVQARDLVDHDRIYVDRRVRSVTYLHLYLPRHEIVLANGVEVESFHPGFADLEQLTDHGRQELGAVDPDVLQHPDCYGAPARRMISAGEARFLSAP